MINATANDGDPCAGRHSQTSQDVIPSHPGLFEKPSPPPSPSQFRFFLEPAFACLFCDSLSTTHHARPPTSRNHRNATNMQFGEMRSINHRYATTMRSISVSAVCRRRKMGMTIIETRPSRFVRHTRWCEAEFPVPISDAGVCVAKKLSRGK